MASRVDIYRLETGNTYQIVKSRKDTDLLDYVHDDSGNKRTYLLARPSIIAQRQPPVITSWDDMQEYEPPRGEGPPSKWMVFTHGDDSIALGLNGPVGTAERRELLDNVELISVQRAQASASKDDTVSKLTGMAMTVMIGIAVVITLVIVLVGVSGYLTRDSGGDVVKETEEQYEVEPPPVGATVVPSEQWQNPRPVPGDQ